MCSPALRTTILNMHGNGNSGLIALARSIGARHSLDPALVCAIVEQESAWEPHALRYEPDFRMRYVAPLRLPPTEEVARSISWGLMQVMGQVAREHGFAGKFLSALCEPLPGLEIGCAVFAAKLAEAQRAARESASPPGAASFLPPPNAPPQNVAPSPNAASKNNAGRLVGPKIALTIRALELWNGGSALGYAAQVLARVPQYQL